MAAQAATARLALDASGFDKQANASFREFSKQLTSVKDATDVAMRGAEALQKVFVKSLGGTIAIGAANALGDAMRDIGSRIGTAADAVGQASAGMTGFSGSLEEAAARAQTLSSASAEVTKALTELSNANPIMSGIFKLFGGKEVLKDLEETTKGLAGLELLTGLQQGNRAARRLQAAGPEGQEAEQQRMADEKARRDLQSSAAFRGADAGTRQKIMVEFEQKLALRDAAKMDERSRKYDAETQKIRNERLEKLADYQEEFTKTMLDRDLADARRARQSERDSAEMLAQAQRDLALLLQQRQREERANRGIRGVRSAAATEILDRSATLGDAAVAASVDRERNRMAEEQRRSDRRALDRAVQANTPEFTEEGARRTMASRRSEFIAQQARTEARGGKTLTDVYSVLQETLNKITAAPMVGN